MGNYSIPNIPVLATQVNDTDLFEKSDGPSSGQSQRLTGLVMKTYFGSAIQSQTVALDNTTQLYSITHGLAATPKFVRVVFLCITNDTDSTYVVGDEIFSDSVITTGSPFRSIGIHSDATHILASVNITFVGNEAGYKMIRPVDGAGVSPTSFANFQLKFYYA